MDASTEVDSDFCDPLVDTYHCGGASDYCDDLNFFNNKATKSKNFEQLIFGVI